MQLIVRTGNGTKAEFPPGLWLYVWSGDNGILRDLQKARDEIELIKPDGLILHGGPTEILSGCKQAVALAASIMGAVNRVAVGIGCDGVAPRWRAGEASEAAVVEPLRRAVKAAYAEGVRFFVPNAEAGWYDSPIDKKNRHQIETLAGNLAMAMCDAAPEGIFCVSSFDQPTYQVGMAPLLRAWTRQFPMYTGQTYVATTNTPSPGAIDRRTAAWQKSQSIAERIGWVSRDVIAEDIADDCDRWPTVQGHRTHPTALARVAIESPHIAVWAAPSIRDGKGAYEGGRLDAQGIQALRFAMQARRAGFVGPGAVEAYQRALGVTADGKPGKITFAAAGITWLDYSDA